MTQYGPTTGELLSEFTVEDARVFLRNCAETIDEQEVTFDVLKVLQGALVAAESDEVLWLEIYENQALAGEPVTLEAVMDASVSNGNYLAGAYILVDLGDPKVSNLEFLSSARLLDLAPHTELAAVYLTKESVLSSPEIVTEYLSMIYGSTPLGWLRRILAEASLPTKSEDPAESGIFKGIGVYIRKAAAIINKIPGRIVQDPTNRFVEPVILNKLVHFPLKTTIEMFPNLTYFIKPTLAWEESNIIYMNEGTWKLLLLTYLMSGKLFNKDGYNELLRLSKPSYLANMSSFLSDVSIQLYKQELGKLVRAPVESESLVDFFSNVVIPHKWNIQDNLADDVIEKRDVYIEECNNAKMLGRLYQGTTAFIDANRLQDIFPKWITEVYDFMHLYVSSSPSGPEKGLPLRERLSSLAQTQDTYTYDELVMLHKKAIIFEELIYNIRLNDKELAQLKAGAHPLSIAMLLEKHLEDQVM